MRSRSSGIGNTGVVAGIIMVAVILGACDVVALTFEPGQSTISSSHSVQTRLYNVTFMQSGACSPAVYTVPWSVTLGSRTEAQPPNATLPVPNGSYGAGPEPPSLFTITFTSVPDGIYNYTIAPADAFSMSSGTVTVNGANLTVNVEVSTIACTTTETN
jgi:hypothetical protein